MPAADARPGITPAVNDYTTLWSVADATGFIPAVKAGASGIAGQFGLPVASDTISKRQLLETGTQKLIKAFALSDRYPVAEMEAIKREIEIKPDVLDSPETLRSRMVAINAAVNRRLDEERRAAKDGNLPVQTRQAALTLANEMENFLSTLGVPPEYGGRYAPASNAPAAGRPSPSARGQATASDKPKGPAVLTPGTVVNGYVFKGGDPKQQSNWAPVQGDRR
jgi:hypothetical protein